MVLMDVQMPEMDGFEATAAIRDRERATGRHTPIIAMTAHAMKGDREECLAGGMDGYVAKPLRPQELYDLIDRWTVPDIIPAPPVATVPTDDPADTPVFDKDAVLELVGGDEDLLQEVVALFLDKSVGLMAEIHEAIASGDAPHLNDAAHSLKARWPTSPHSLPPMQHAGSKDGPRRRPHASRGNLPCPGDRPRPPEARAGDPPDPIVGTLISGVKPAFFFKSGFLSVPPVTPIVR